jgi:hypothetical protein
VTIYHMVRRWALVVALGASDRFAPGAEAYDLRAVFAMVLRGQGTHSQPLEVRIMKRAFAFGLALLFVGAVLFSVGCFFGPAAWAAAATDGKALAITPDRTRVVATLGNRLKVWDLSTGACLKTLPGGTSPLAVTPDGTKLVSGSLDDTLKVWDLGTGGCLHTRTGHTDLIWAVALTPDGTKAVSASADATLMVWDLTTGARLHTLTSHTEEALAVAVTPDGTKIVSGSSDRTIKIWDLTTGACLKTLTTDHRQGRSSVRSCQCPRIVHPRISRHI